MKNEIRQKGKSIRVTGNQAFLKKVRSALDSLSFTRTATDVTVDVYRFAEDSQVDAAMKLINHTLEPQPVIHMKDDSGFEFKVFALNKGESMDDPTSTKAHRRFYGPGIVSIEYSGGGMYVKEWYVNSPDFWNWMKRLITTGNEFNLRSVDDEA